MKAILFVIVCFGLSFTTSAYYNDSAVFYLKQALQYKQLRKVNDADANFKKALELNPADNDTRVEYGIFLVEERKYFVAADHFKKILQANNNHPAALYKMTELSYLMHRWKEVISYGSKLKESRAGLRLNYMLGCAYYEEEDYGLSERCLTEAVKEEPKHIEAITLLGKVYIELSNYKQAVQLYNQALEIQPDNNKLIYEAGLLQFTLNNEEEAVKYFELAAQKGFKVDLAYTENLGMAYLGFDIKKGIEILGKVLEKKPNDPEIIWQIAEAYYKTKQYQYAADLYYKIYEKDNTDAKALYMIGVAYQKKGDKAQGISFCEKAIQMDPTLAELKRLVFGK